jgi:hypothetical protein
MPSPPDRFILKTRLRPGDRQGKAAAGKFQAIDVINQSNYAMRIVEMG